MIKPPILSDCTQLVLLLNSLNDRSSFAAFERPMSKAARKLLADVIDASVSFSMLKPKRAAQILVDGYDPIKYEDAVHRYDSRSIIKGIPKKIKTEEQYKYYVTLDCTKDPAWLEKNEISANRNKVGSIEQDGVIKLYNWFTTKFLASDFSEHDLNKIVHMGSDIFDINVIMSEGLKIKDLDKHTVSYLYAIARDASIRHHNARQKEEEERKINAERLATLVNNATNLGTSIVYEPTDSADLTKIRLFADIARSKKD